MLWTILLLVLLISIAGGGVGYRRYGWRGMSPLGVVLLVILVLYVMGYPRFGRSVAPGSLLRPSSPSHMQHEYGRPPTAFASLQGLIQQAPDHRCDSGPSFSELISIDHG